MIDNTDVNLAVDALNLRVALEAKIRIAFDQQFPIQGAMRGVANRAAFAQRLVLEDERACLVPVALRAALIEPRHREATAGLEDVAAMRIMALHAIHAALDHRMVLRQVELRVDLQVALKAGARIFPRIDNELAAPAARLNMLAARAVARFTAGFAVQSRAFKMKAPVRARGENAGDVGMALRAGLVSHEGSAGNLRRGHDRSPER